MLKAITFLSTLMIAATIGASLQGGEPACGTEGGSACAYTCPKCGCGLVPACNIQCTTKKVTEYKYGCRCEEICVPAVTPICKRGCCCDEDACEASCGRCAIHEIHKLVKYPTTKEVPVRKCTVEWVCPSCNCHYVDETPQPASK